MKSFLKTAAAILAAITAFMLLSYSAAALLIPPRREYGSTWETYLEEPENSVDVMFFGSSLAYCDVIPAVIWEETGLTSYVMAGPEQTIPISYYYLKEACKTQHPQAACLELTGMFYNKFQNYTKVNIGYMPWGINRLAATFCAAEKEQMADLIFPLFSYHDCVYTASLSSISKHFHPGTDIYAGYTYLTESRPQSSVAYRDFSAGTYTYEQNLGYLKRIAEYCEKNGILLICFTAPCMSRIPSDALKVLEADVDEIGCVYYNCNDPEKWPELSELDGETVWYDSLHYNFSGAVPFSRAFAARLADLDIAPGSYDHALWHDRLEAVEKNLQGVR